MYTQTDFLNIALSQVGYLEKGSNADLDDKTKNAGSQNYTKYARDLHEAGYYSGNKQGVAWCSMFVDWCHYMAAGQQKALAQKISCQSGIYGASCKCSMDYYKEAGRFFTSDPKPGDQIYFGSGKSVTHTGIVCQADRSRVYTIEGNTSPSSGVVSNGGGVYQKSYALTDKKILGYGRPRWENEPEIPGKTCLVTLPVLEKGSRGEAVRVLQLLLQAKDFRCGSWGTDGNFGSATYDALCGYQRQYDLQVDGVAGPETYQSLLGAK